MRGVLIADDEAIIREGLRQSVDWGSLGLQVVGEASNGEEAIKAIVQWEPSILITDIKMPKKNGLEVTQLAKQLFPEMIVIILSGYSDFDYARQAIQGGAFDYILKPTVFADVMEVITRAVRLIELEEQRKSDFERFKTELRRNITFYRSAFLHKLLSSPLLDERMQQHLPETLWLYEMKEDGPVYLLACKVDEFDSLRYHSEEQLRVYLLALEHYIAGFLASVPGAYAVSIKDDLFVIVLQGDEPQGEQDLLRLCEELQESLKSHYLPITISIGISKEKQSMLDLHKAYLEACEALEHILYLGKDAIIFYDGLYDQHEITALTYPLFAECSRSAVKAVLIGDSENALRHIHQLFHWFEVHGVTREAIQSVCMELGALIYVSLDNGKQEQIYTSRDEYYNEIKNGQTSERIFHVVQSFVQSLSEQIFQKTHSSHKKLVQQVLRLIQSHYMNDLTLNWVAKQVHLNTSYLSRLLKNECGENFTQLLAKQRIDQAKALLKDPTVKIYEVSDKVGIADPHYFAVLFKKQTGMSPSEFRDHFEEIF
ncbi:response regulator [Paenibacillus cremeus]|uniref:Response regulator n=1 Tax=Paenibacillus cremeus TaxID=2163881 RepID=A0A559JHP0_9BACL|nr:response regulator [Paenibacillus cremeus]TVX99390.1 response regulator [Paenibacillus cremeus]